MKFRQTKSINLRKITTMKTTHKPSLFAAAPAGAVVLTGCKSIGLGTVATDRFNYNSSIANSWKQHGNN